VRDVQHNDNATEAYTLTFGGDGRAAYIDDQHYAAIESPQGTWVTRSYDQSGAPVNYDNASATSYLASGDQLGVTKFFPQTFGVNGDGSAPAFCANCDFLKWGAWGTRVGFGNTGSSQYVDNIHSGWFVAGDVVQDTVGMLPTTGSASYAGNTIGTVANSLGQTPITYTATGNMNMAWDFGRRSGTFNVSNFDTSVAPQGLNFGGTMNMPGVPSGGLNQFAGDLGGAGPTNIGALSGNANGSFVGSPGSGLAPNGVIGNWNIANDTGYYKATGIFAGKH